jgi:uncharacterized protein (TIRG00374 family)
MHMRMRRFLPSLITVAIIVTLSVFQRDLLSEIFNRLGGIHPLGFIPLLGAGGAVIVARGLFLRSCSPGISLRQSITADQTALAAGYGIAIGGGAIGTAMRIHMFTKWGLTSQVIATSIVATAVVPSFTTWGLPIVVLIWPFLSGNADTVETIALWAGVVLVSTSAMFWWMALRWPWMFSLVGRVGGLLRGLILRRLPKRFWRTRKFAERTTPQKFTDELRLSLAQLIRTRGLMIIASSGSTLLASFLALWTSAQLFGVTGLSLAECVIAFSLIRVLVALSPIPGGVGIAELGLIALLENAGLSTLDATGTTILYRFLTWFLPIVVGTVLWWRYSHQRQEKNNGTLRDDNSQYQDPSRGVRLHG